MGTGNTSPWIEIFATGQWHGQLFGIADIDQIIENFNRFKSNIKPPLVFGHDEAQELLKKSGLEAGGYLVALKRSGEVLLGKFGDVPKVVSKVIANKTFRNVSVEIALDFKGNGKTLRRIALLGGELPEVHTLQEIAALGADTLDAKTLELATAIGGRIRSVREEKGLTIEDVASSLPIDASTLSKIENGEIGVPSRPVMAAISERLGISVKTLIDLLPDEKEDEPAEDVINAAPRGLILCSTENTHMATDVQKVTRSTKEVTEGPAPVATNLAEDEMPRPEEEEENPMAQAVAELQAGMQAMMERMAALEGGGGEEMAGDDEEEEEEEMKTSAIKDLENQMSALSSGIHSREVASLKSELIQGRKITPAVWEAHEPMLLQMSADQFTTAQETYRSAPVMTNGELAKGGVTPKTAETEEEQTLKFTAAYNAEDSRFRKHTELSGYILMCQHDAAKVGTEE